MKLKTFITSNFTFLLLLLVSIFYMNCQSEKQETQIKESPQLAKTDVIETKGLIFNFNDYKPGNLPDNWETAVTGKGKPGKWEIVTDETATGQSKVLAQTSMENFGYHFDIAVAKDTNFKDLFLTVKFNAIDGEEDQGGGPVWRYQDADNYYIARANPLESNFRVYKIINGNRKQLKSCNLPVTSGQWHTIQIEHIGTHIKCYYDGQLCFEVDDETFTAPGKIGVWTKADSYCCFDDLTVEEKL